MAWVLCDCNAAVPCPQGHVGSEKRCIIYVQEPVAINAYRDIMALYHIGIYRNEEKIIK